VVASAALANRLFEILGDSVALDVVRQLQQGPHTQKELVEAIGAPQSAVSRAASTLRFVGLATASSARGKLTLRAPRGVEQLLAAANGLAVDLLAEQSTEQASLSANSADWRAVAGDAEHEEAPR
jgi:DNA-binding transcriptional ArsR family regulator